VEARCNLGGWGCDVDGGGAWFGIRAGNTEEEDTLKISRGE